MSMIKYTHKLGAHCESSTVATLLNYYDVDISEAMIFGISGTIFFAYLNSPMMHFPTFALRDRSGKIYSNVTSYLGPKFHTARFKNKEKAMYELDRLLEEGHPVGVQVDFFYMEYIPAFARAHFNGHYVIVVGKENGDYIVSDCYAPVLARVGEETMKIARFARGTFSPGGFMFYKPDCPQNMNYKKAIVKGIKHASFYNLRLPVPIFGVRGIRYFAKELLKWPSYARDAEHFSDEIMLVNVILEERGTGGGGFRYLYASFLQEAADILGEPALREVAEKMMANGDEWRMVSLHAGRIGKERNLGRDSLMELGKMLNKRADVEEKLFKELSAIVKHHK